MIQALLTTKTFLETRADLPDAGAWAELLRGVPVTLQPPDLDHGNTLLNLSKLFAAYATPEITCYPCFDLGLIVERRPDTVIFPAVSFFEGETLFQEFDKEATETVPRLVVELVSTNDRRKNIGERVGLYHDLGVAVVWVIDPGPRTVHVLPQTGMKTRLSEFETLRGDPVLTGFSVGVGELFAEPEWAV